MNLFVWKSLHKHQWALFTVFVEEDSFLGGPVPEVVVRISSKQFPIERSVVRITGLKCKKG